MNPDRDDLSEMPRVAIDDATAEPLLSGRLAPEDAPPGWAGLAALIQTTTGPASPTELAQERWVIAASAAAVTSSLTPRTPVSRRSSTLAKRLTAKVAAAAAVATLGLGTAAAAATGSLPGQTSHGSSHARSGLAAAASRVSTHPARSGPAPGSATVRDATSRTTTAATPTSIPAAGPANIHAQFGLCTAFLAGNHNAGGVTSATLPPQDASTAFQALIHQNGGVAATTTYCQGLVKAGKPSDGGTPSGTAQPPTTGKPSDTGKAATTGMPSGTGKPATTGGPASAGRSGSHAPVTTPNPGGTGTADTASGGRSSTGTGTANTASGGASGSGSGNASGR